MNELKAKLIISDFDSTLTDCANRVPASVCAAINEYVAAGGLFAVCTGRMLASILPRVRALGLKGMVVACQGTVIADIESGGLIRSGGMSAQDTAEVCAALEELNAPVNVYCGDDMYTDIPADNPHLRTYEDIVGILSKHAEEKLSAFVLRRNMRCEKVATLCSPRDRQRLYEEMKARFGDKHDVTCSAEVLVEIAPRGDNKGAALRFLAEKYGVNIADTVAVGDNLNDLSMIEAAGTGVAVGNAVEGLKQRADFVAVTSDEGAVAQVIYKFGFGRV